MPLIHDNPWLINQLLHAAVDEEERLKLFKKGQEDPAASPASGALRALLVNLQNQIKAPASKPGEVGQMEGAVDLASHHMDSMGDFVEWLHSHQTPIGGKIIVKSATPERPGNDYDFYRIEPGTKILTQKEGQEQRPTRSDRTEVGYWINTAGLKQYLQLLQSDKDLRTNVMFQVQLLKLIQFANEQLDTGIGETYQAPELDDEKEVDRLPKMLHLNQWNEAGTEPLLYKNIKSLGAFNSWYGQPGRGYFVGERPVTIKDQEWNVCTVLAVLSTRANALLQRRTEESGPVMQVYVKQIATLQKEAGCPGGSGTQPGGGGDQPGGAGQMSARALIGLAMLKPFNSERINFEEMTTFLDEYVKLRPAAGVMAQTAKNAMQQVNGIAISQNGLIPTNDLKTPAGMKSLTQNPKQYLQYLDNVISSVGKVYMDFFNVSQSMLKERSPSTLSSIEEQITRGGPYWQNLQVIRTMMAQYP